MYMVAVQKLILELSMTSLLGKLRCAKASLEVTLPESKDPMAVQPAHGAMQHSAIIWPLQRGTLGFGSGDV